MISQQQPVPCSATFDRSANRLSDAGRVFPSGVRIDRTSYGLGVFAFAFIPKETPIARVPGKMIYDADYSSDYCINAGDDKVLEPGPPFCYMNHSCEPNCQLLQYVREGEENEDESLEDGVMSAEELDFDEEAPETESYVDAVLTDDDECFFGDGGAAEYESDCLMRAEDDSLESGDEDEEMLFEDDADAEIWVEALRDIMPGEELTIDYAWPADRAAKCLCGSPTCRGWIVDPEELDEIEERS